MNMRLNLALSTLLASPATKVDPSLRIVHRMVQYQQQDSQGRLFNIVRIVLAKGSQRFVEEYEDVEEDTEKLFDLSLAQGHRWYLTNRTMRVKPQHSHEECGICKNYDSEPVATYKTLN